MCTCFAWSLSLLARGVFPVLVTLIIFFFRNWTDGPSQVFFTLIITFVSSVYQYLSEAPLSDFAIFVVCCGLSTIDLHNNTDVLYCLISSTLVLLAGINPTCQVQFCSLPNILLHYTASLWWPSAGFLQYLPGWENIMCVQK